jgi:hypothetical protein
MDSYNSVRGVVARYTERSARAVLFAPTSSNVSDGGGHMPQLTAAYDVARFVGSAVHMYSALGALEVVGVVESSVLVDDVVDDDDSSRGEWRVVLRLTATGAMRAFLEDALRDGIFVAPATRGGRYAGMRLVWHSLCPGSECLERRTASPLLPSSPPLIMQRSSLARLSS